MTQPQPAHPNPRAHGAVALMGWAQLVARRRAMADDAPAPEPTRTEAQEFLAGGQP